MIGPLTLQAYNAVDEFIKKISSHIHTELTNSNQHTGKIIWHSTILLAAYAVCKHQEIHPKILWGNLWFLHYQAWLWKFSKEWREITVEKWLRMLEGNGKLETLLDEPGQIY